MSDEKIKELRAASDDAYSAAYRVADAATAADRVAVAAWDEYQSALKAKGGGE